MLHKTHVQFSSSNFLYRLINPNKDDLTNYRNWMRDKTTNPFIKGANSNLQLNELNEYVVSKNDSSSALLLGVFSIDSNTHIGNIKFEPIEIQKCLAWVGILVGEMDFRGKGFGHEILMAGISFMKVQYGINEFKLGVDSQNTQAIKLYRRAGFVAESKSSSRDKFVMVLHV